MLATDHLRLKDEYTFEEAEIPPSRERPLEWRRSFNVLRFKACELRVEYVYTINEVEYFNHSPARDSASGKSTSSPYITPVGTRKLVIGATASASDLRDTIYVAKEKEKGGPLFTFVRPRGPLQVVLAACRT